MNGRRNQRIFDDKMSCLSDLSSVITMNMHWYGRFTGHMQCFSDFLTLISIPGGYCSCLWSWLWWLWFLTVRQFIDLPYINLPGWETVCSCFSHSSARLQHTPEGFTYPLGLITSLPRLHLDRSPYTQTLKDKMKIFFFFFTFFFYEFCLELDAET